MHIKVGENFILICLVSDNEMKTGNPKIHPMRVYILINHFREYFSKVEICLKNNILYNPYLNLSVVQGKHLRVAQCNIGGNNKNLGTPSMTVSRRREVRVAVYTYL